MNNFIWSRTLKSRIRRCLRIRIYSRVLCVCLQWKSQISEIWQRTSKFRISKHISGAQDEQTFEHWRKHNCRFLNVSVICFFQFGARHVLQRVKLQIETPQHLRHLRKTKFILSAQDPWTVSYINLTSVMFYFQTHRQLFSRRSRDDIPVATAIRYLTDRHMWPNMRESILERNLTVVSSVGNLLTEEKTWKCINWCIGKLLYDLKWSCSFILFLLS